MEAAAQAHANVALVKYWGKRDAALNLPATGSLSVTLHALRTRTRVRFDATLGSDELHLDGRAHAPAPERVRVCLDLLRAHAGVRAPARVDSDNDFPTGAGLASSSSGFAALVVAAAGALGLDLLPRELSRIARHGSGSAARSIFGGFVEMSAGVRADGADAHASPLLGAADWPLEVVIAITSRKAKPVGSSEGMELTRTTSPFYDAWLAATIGDLAEAREAIVRRDFAALASVSERNCLRMHAAMLGSRPPLIYMNGATIDCLRAIRALRDDRGRATFFTVDAGPQVKAVCLPADAPHVAEALRAVPGVDRVLTTGLGEGARAVPETTAPEVH
jgi:diphosphomevalonate decarboxylase